MIFNLVDQLLNEWFNPVKLYFEPSPYIGQVVTITTLKAGQSSIKFDLTKGLSDQKNLI